MSERNAQTTYYPIKGSSQNVSYTGTAASSTAMAAYTTIVRLVSTTDCRVSFEQTATSTSMRLIANIPEYFSIKSLETISVIQDTVAGTLSITEMTQ